MRQQVRVDVLYTGQHDSDWPSSDATECVGWFAGKLALIPEQYRATAKIEFDTDYDSYLMNICIYYDRPETDEEMSAREAQERWLDEKREAEERRELATLKAKYES